MHEDTQKHRKHKISKWQKTNMLKYQDESIQYLPFQQSKVLCVWTCSQASQRWQQAQLREPQLPVRSASLLHLQTDPSDRPLPHSIGHCSFSWYSPNPSFIYPTDPIEMIVLRELPGKAANYSWYPCIDFKPDSIQCIQKVFRPLHFFHILLCYSRIIKFNKCFFPLINLHTITKMTKKKQVIIYKT